MEMYIDTSVKRGRGAPLKKEEEKSKPTSYSIKIKNDRILRENCERLGYTYSDKVGEGIEFFNLLCDSIEARRLEISRIEFEIKEKQERLIIIKTSIEKSERMESKAAHRFENSIYLLELQKVADDFRRKPEKIRYLNERAGRISEKHELPRHFVVQDIRDILAGHEFAIPDITRVHDMLKEEAGL